MNVPVRSGPFTPVQSADSAVVLGTAFIVCMTGCIFCVNRFHLEVQPRQSNRSEAYTFERNDL